MNFLKKNHPAEETEGTTPPKSLLKKFLLAGFVVFLSCLIMGFIGASVVYFRYADELPDVTQFISYQPSTITQVFADDDELIAQFYIEKRIMLPIAQIPLRLKQATLAVEDSNFYSHFGIDPKAIFRASLVNFRAGRVVEGASTITQQLSKRLFLSPEKTLPRKIKEAILAIRLELLFSKDQILEMYLNQIYYGHGSYGVEAAALTYFGISAKDLTLEQCAMLAALPKAPTNYSPFRKPERAKKRRDHSLRRMAHIGFITEEEKEVALATELDVGDPPERENKAPHFVETIRRQLLDTYGSNKLYRGGLKVYTTLNLEYQAAAQRALKKNLRLADKRYGYRGPLGYLDPHQGLLNIQAHLRKLNKFKEEDRPTPDTNMQGLVMQVNSDNVRVELGGEEGVIALKDMDWARKPNIKVDGRWARIVRPSAALNPGDVILVRVLGQREDIGPRWSLALEQEPEVEAALVSIEPSTGHIKAMVGGYDYGRSEFNRAVQAIRQPGSSFKPVIYATAVEQGFTPASIVVDSPIIFKEKEEAFDQWKPVNFEEKFYGPTSLRTALTHSRNIVTVKLLQNVGIGSATKMARSLGITSPLSQNLSIALGSSGVSLLEITGVYSIFANMGQRIEPQSMRHIQNRNDETLFTARPHISQPISSGIAHTINSLLQSVVQHGTGKPVKVLGRPVAGKTGTTNNYVDAWFIGYTPGLATGVWVGRDDVSPLGVNETGSRAAIPIWLQYMQDALIDIPPKNFPVSDEIVYRKVSNETGEPASYDDPNSHFEIMVDPLLEDLPATADPLEPENKS